MKPNPRILTGIKPTGTLHIGNYVGAILPMVELVESNTGEIQIFVADYHALNNENARPLVAQHTVNIVAAYLSCGMNPNKCSIYRQSAISEIFELAVLLSNFVPKGLMNRAHAYKAVAQENKISGKDPDSGVNMGLYNYPMLMAADILAFDTDVVPVGKDQRQHIEFARDIAGSFNAGFSQGLVLPQGQYQENYEELPGTDGRKMSKSYDNVIPIFAESKAIRKKIMKIKTDSKLPDEPKSASDAIILKMLRPFTSDTEYDDFSERYCKGGMGYGEAKSFLADRLEEHFCKPKEKYFHYLENEKEIKEILLEGEEKVRQTAKNTLLRLKKQLLYI